MYILLTFFLFVCSMEEWNMNGQSLWSSGDCGLIRQIQIQWKMKSHNPLTEEWLLFLLRKVDLTSSHSLSIILICVRRRLMVTKKKNGKSKKGLGNCYIFPVHVLNCIFGKTCKHKWQFTQYVGLVTTVYRSSASVIFESVFLLIKCI